MDIYYIFPFLILLAKKPPNDVWRLVFEITNKKQMQI